MKVMKTFGVLRGCHGPWTQIHHVCGNSWAELVREKKTRASICSEHLRLILPLDMQSDCSPWTWVCTRGHGGMLLLLYLVWLYLLFLASCNHGKTAKGESAIWHKNVTIFLAFPRRKKLNFMFHNMEEWNLMKSMYDHCTYGIQRYWQHHSIVECDPKTGSKQSTTTVWVRFWPPHSHRCLIRSTLGPRPKKRCLMKLKHQKPRLWTCWNWKRPGPEIPKWKFFETS